MAELSGLEVFGLLKEIGEALPGTYLNNIYTAGAAQVLRFRRAGSGDVWVVASPKKGVWISKNISERAETSEFTSRLRRELERARFLGSSQVGLDRVFVLEFDGDNGRKLIVEMMPPGNIIVTGADWKIILAQEEVRTPARTIGKGAAYQPPKQTRTSPADLDEKIVRSMLEGEDRVGGALGRKIGLPRKYIQEGMARLGVEDGSPASTLAGREGEVAQVMKGLVREARENPEPCICDSARGEEIFIIHPRSYPVKVAADTLSELCDRVFLAEATKIETPVTEEEQREKELVATIANLKAEAETLKMKASNFRSMAERARGASREEARAILRDSGLKTKGAPDSSESIASIFYDRAKEIEAKSSEALGSAARLEKRLGTRPKSSGPRPKALPKRRQEWFEKFRWFTTGEGKLAVGGRDAQTNSLLIGRYVEPEDTVYHADLFGSPFFVLKGGKGQTEEEVRQVASATVSFSSAWKTGLGAADAYWVFPDQVSSSAPSGEYLSKGSFAITGKKNFVRKIIVEIGIGVDPSGRIMAGPEEAVGKHSSFYVVLRPHHEKSSDTAKRVRKELSELGGLDGRLDIDDILRALPTGGGKVLRKISSESKNEGPKG